MKVNVFCARLTEDIKQSLRLTLDLGVTRTEKACLSRLAGKSADSTTLVLELLGDKNIYSETLPPISFFSEFKFH